MDSSRSRGRRRARAGDHLRLARAVRAPAAGANRLRSVRGLPFGRSRAAAAPARAGRTYAAANRPVVAEVSARGLPSGSARARRLRLGRRRVSTAVGLKIRNGRSRGVAPPDRAVLASGCHRREPLEPDKGDFIPPLSNLLRPSATANLVVAEGLTSGGRAFDSVPRRLRTGTIQDHETASCRARFLPSAFASCVSFWPVSCRRDAGWRASRGWDVRGRYAVAEVSAPILPTASTRAADPPCDNQRVTNRARAKIIRGGQLSCAPCRRVRDARAPCASVSSCRSVVVRA